MRARVEKVDLLGWNKSPFVPLLSHPIRSLRHIIAASSSIMVIFIKEEHLFADVSYMMSLELQRHCNNFFKAVYANVFPQFIVQPRTEYTRTNTLNS